MNDTGFVRQPFSASFLLIGVVGFLVSLYYTWFGMLNLTYGLLFMLMFAIFAVAALRSFEESKSKKVEMVKKPLKKKAKKVVKRRK
ncbi:MAG: hypothetical protein WC471_00785 [Candidatus Woesearchaeota archaeon]